MESGEVICPVTSCLGLSHTLTRTVLPESYRKRRGSLGCPVGENDYKASKDVIQGDHNLVFWNFVSCHFLLESFYFPKYLWGTFFGSIWCLYIILWKKNTAPKGESLDHTSPELSPRQSFLQRGHMYFSTRELFQVMFCFLNCSCCLKPGSRTVSLWARSPVSLPQRSLRSTLLLSDTW